MDSILQQLDWAATGEITAATTALSTAASGLVDATKAFGGGISNVGYAEVRKALQPFQAALAQVDREDPFGAIKANWLNGVDKSEQKLAARNLIRLGLNPNTAVQMAAALPGVDGDQLKAAAAKMGMSETLTQEEIDLLGRFDAAVDVRLNAAYERADQKFRNVAKVTSATIAMVLSFLAAWLLVEDGKPVDYIAALFVGLLATPLAPIAKDLMSSITTAAAAFKAAKR